MCRVLSSAPFDLVDLLLDFQRLEVIELWLMGLELCVKLVLAAFFLFIAFMRSIDPVEEGLKRRTKEGWRIKEAGESESRSVSARNGREAGF
jgi:hypothetical protein